MSNKKRPEKLTKTSISLPVNLLKKIDKCRKLFPGMTRSDFVRNAVKAYLVRRENREPLHTHITKGIQNTTCSSTCKCKSSQGGKKATQGKREKVRRSKRKDRILNLFSSTKKVLFYSDLVASTGYDLEEVVNICEELLSEKKIRVEERE